MKNGPCNLCIIKMLCTVLCKEKIEHVCDKVVERKKLKRPNFSKRGGIPLWDFMNELRDEGIMITYSPCGDFVVTQYNNIKVEVLNGTIERTTAST